jgi:hypothetical protein
MSYETEIAYFKQGRKVMKAAKIPAKSIAASFSNLSNVLSRLDSKNGDIIDADDTEENFIDSKHAAYGDIKAVQSFFERWESFKTQMDALNSNEIKSLVGLLVTLCTPPKEPPVEEEIPEQE